MVELPASQVTLGIYEKALRDAPDLAHQGKWRQEHWHEWFKSAAEAGFSFIDLSIDESPSRLERLNWTWEQRQMVRAAAAATQMQIGGICLSAHRAIMPGSADATMRRKAQEIYRQGIDFCVDLGIPVVQVAGYFAYYEAPNPKARERYLQTLAKALPYAHRRGVILAIENVDGPDLAAIPQVMAVLDELPSPWLQCYPDIGNIAEHGGDATTELQAGQGRMVALHVKDVLPRQPRRIPLGSGCADFTAAFTELARQRWSGRIMIEMWNDDSIDSLDKCVDARKFLEKLLYRAQITVIEAPARPDDKKEN